MSSIVYAIVFSGEVVEGFQPFSVKAHMAKMLKADATKIVTLFSGKQIVLKRTEDKEEALRYGSALKKIGADVKIKAIKSEEAAPQPSAVAKHAAPSTATPKPATANAIAATAPGAPATELSLAPNEGFIVPPKAPEPPPPLDLSAMSLAENDGTPLIEATPFEEADVDISALSLKDNDGTPLVEHIDKGVPVVDVPDFGLDAPGAMLETLKEEKTLLNPDTSGLSIAAAGVDLLEPEDRPKGPPPLAPDISKIHLVPNFDIR